VEENCLGTTKLLNPVSFMLNRVGGQRLRVGCHFFCKYCFVLAKPGEDTLSKVVNAAINFKPLYGAMKFLAKRVIKGTAEKSGVPWDKAVVEWQNTPEVGAECASQSLPQLCALGPAPCMHACMLVSINDSFAGINKHLGTNLWPYIIGTSSSL
jgi:hypothetical protein